LMASLLQYSFRTLQAFDDGVETKVLSPNHTLKLTPKRLFQCRKKQKSGTNAIQRAYYFLNDIHISECFACFKLTRVDMEEWASKLVTLFSLPLNFIQNVLHFGFLLYGFCTRGAGETWKGG
jgi:hypothetical protein